MKPFYEDKWVRIYNQNCLDTMKRMEDSLIDLTVTSPPYDNLREYIDYPFTFEFEQIAKELYRVTKQGGVVVWITGDATIKGSETGTSFRQALGFKEVGFNLHDTMIYQKANCKAYDPNNKRYKQVIEFMFILSKGSPNTYNPIKGDKCKTAHTEGLTSRKRDGSMRTSHPKIVEHNEYPDRYNIWIYNTGYMQSTKDHIAYRHPAIMPDRLANDHIISWSNEGDLVFDPFVGSGTTLKMAKLNNRKSIGVDISEEYCHIAKERCSQEVMELNV